MQMALDFTRYPDRAGWRGQGVARECSKDAADKVDAKRLQAEVLANLRDAGPATFYEMAERLGRHTRSVQPRFSELERQGLVRKSGARRPTPMGATASVWEAI